MTGERTGGRGMGQRPDLTSFGRYTREALRTLFAARRELERLGGESVQPEHLLLALLDPDAGSVAALLQSLDVPCQSVRDELEARLVRPGQIADQTDLPLSPEMRSVLDHSLL